MVVEIQTNNQKKNNGLWKMVKEAGGCLISSRSYISPSHSTENVHVFNQLRCVWKFETSYTIADIHGGCDKNLPFVSG